MLQLPQARLQRLTWRGLARISMIPLSADCPACTALLSHSRTAVEPFSVRVRHTAHERIPTKMDRGPIQPSAPRHTANDRIMTRPKERR